MPKVERKFEIRNVKFEMKKYEIGIGDWGLETRYHQYKRMIDE